MARDLSLLYQLLGSGGETQGDQTWLGQGGKVLQGLGGDSSNIGKLVRDLGLDCPCC